MLIAVKCRDGGVARHVMHLDGNNNHVTTMLTYSKVGTASCIPNPAARPKFAPHKGCTMPTNWPTDILYIAVPRYAPNFPERISALLQGSSVGKLSPPKLGLQPAPTIIRRIESPSHPAFGQRGLFAAKTIPSNTFIIQYVGELHADERPTSDYDLSLIKLPTSSLRHAGQNSDNDLLDMGFISVGIDAAEMGNEARFVNDYRGTGQERPNAFFKDVQGRDDTPHITIWTGSKPIAKGKEILVSYGKGWWAARRRDG